MFYGKVHRIRDEALCVSQVVQFPSLCDIATGCDSNFGPQDHPREMSRSISSLVHEAFDLVNVIKHDNTGVRAQMQIPKLMACRQRCDQQFFRVPAS